ncbi:MAG: ATP-grasp domain-containing protein [Deltaproteobacteria bacterium]|nr:MAG: ATP-grasp domain-containing protein [Deltaproteobacteria bacterium]
MNDRLSKFRALRRLGIANRGEAALRCIRAVKALRAEEGSDLVAVALYTGVDRNAPFVRHADVAVRLEGADSALAAHLDHAVLLAGLRAGGCDAVWPGWGFVAEDPAFADLVVAEGLRFLGPSGDVMRLLGDKIAAKELAERAGVPVIPWSGGRVDDAEHAARCAREIGFPLAIKAAASGGGRGIRMVPSAGELAAAFRSARSEAEASFGDGRLFLERRLTGGRHIEVQVAADGQGRVVSLGCRDCSVQRRHQKLIEEAPPAGIPPERLADIETAAVELARRVGYCGVGTVEFLVTGRDFFFLEVNPRLQVEHAISEAVRDVDLVQLQIRIARGESIPPTRTAAHGVAIEARVCAEDPDREFLPSPGRIACFDPALGPRIRIDAGVVVGCEVPPDFDSLLAKVIASGATREEARARLVSALRDFDLAIEGGASNKGFLIEVLSSEEFRAGKVDTDWLERFSRGRAARRLYAVESLVAAAILAYQRRRYEARSAFFADTTNVSFARVPAATGQEIELLHGADAYRLRVFAVGNWRYRVHLDGRVVEARLREDRTHAATLELGGRSLRVLHDATESHLRVEIEGHPQRFGWETTGHVRAGTPALVIGIHVEPGDAVALGQPLGLLEAMKMEIAFRAPVSGTVTEVCVRRGQQVAADEILLKIDPAHRADAEASAGERLRLPAETDPLDHFFARGREGPSGQPDLAAAAALDAADRRLAVEAARDEIYRLLLGYDANPERVEKLVAVLETPLPDGLPEAFRREVFEICHELALFADVEQLFSPAPSTVAGIEEAREIRPSNLARLRMYVRRMRAGGAGIAADFLDLLRTALAHYGVSGLAYGDALERAVLRLLATRGALELRERLAMAIVRRLLDLARTGLAVHADPALADVLARIEAMRGQVPNALADAATEARYTLFEAPELERQTQRSAAAVDAALAAIEISPGSPLDPVLLQLADAPRGVFDRVGSWVSSPDAHRRSLALGAHVVRRYCPSVPEPDAPRIYPGDGVTRFELADGRVVLGGVPAPGRLLETLRRLCDAAAEARRTPEARPVDAIELLVPCRNDEDASTAAAAVRSALAGGFAARRLTLGILPPDGRDDYVSFVPTDAGGTEALELHGLHPETAARVGLDRYAAFELDRLPAPDGTFAFAGRAREVPNDERIFVLTVVRGRAPGNGSDAGFHLTAFEHAFYEASRTLRNILSERDPERRLQWNRVALFVAPTVVVDRRTTESITRRLYPATRHLGLEKVLVQVRLAPKRPGLPARRLEAVIADPGGSGMELLWRRPHAQPLHPAGAYERKVVKARRRNLVYPYEIIRMLCGSQPGGAASLDPKLPRGRFEEYDLDPDTLQAVPVERAHGLNTCGIVLGVISTPTEKVPEGMRRVLLLSDPTLGMGSLGPPECDRVIAAIDLAVRLRVPVEWVPVSSGARIAMDSGTENLDATARVVRRIVTFTQAGGVIHVIVNGVNVGAQSYWDALATMLMHTRGALIMTPKASMVLTGSAALDASGGVSADDEIGIGGFEPVMGPSGQAQYFARDLEEAYAILYDHYRYTYVVPGEPGPRRHATIDRPERSITDTPYPEGLGETFRRVGEIFDDATNPERKRPFAMRAVMRALVDADGGSLERWPSVVGGETAIVWDAHLGGHPVCLIGIESRNVPRQGYRPIDGPESWTGGTLFPTASKKVARALNAASGNRPVAILANLSGFDGSPESMRRLQLEYGAEIARAVVNFQGPIFFVVVSRYHGGAYVVFSRALNENLRASALLGSYASVIGGAPAAKVVFTREVRARAVRDPRVKKLQRALRNDPTPEARGAYERVVAEAVLEKQAEVAAEFDAIHTVERAREVGSLEHLLEAQEMRADLIRELDRRAPAPPTPDPAR